VLAGTDVVFALGLVALAKAQGPEGLFGAWIILGVGRYGRAAPQIACADDPCLLAALTLASLTADIP
jgi:hypothetical protein